MQTPTREIKTRTLFPILKKKRKFSINEFCSPSGCVGRWHVEQLLQCQPFPRPTPCRSTHADVEVAIRNGGFGTARRTDPSSVKGGSDFSPIQSMAVNIDPHPDISIFRFCYHLITDLIHSFISHIHLIGCCLEDRNSKEIQTEIFEMEIRSALSLLCGCPQYHPIIFQKNWSR